MSNRARIQFPFVEQVYLIGADLFWPELIRGRLKYLAKAATIFR